MGMESSGFICDRYNPTPPKHQKKYDGFSKPSPDITHLIVRITESLLHITMKYVTISSTLQNVTFH